MTDVTTRNRINRLDGSLRLLLGLPERRLAYLASAIRQHRVSLPMDDALRLPLGVPQSHIDSYRRDMVDYSPDGVARLRARRQGAIDAKNTDLATKLQRRIEGAPDKLEAARAALADAERRRQEREIAFRHWLKAGTMPAKWRDVVVAALRHNVTYVRFMNTRGDRIGTLYVERD